MADLLRLSPSDFKYLWEQCKHCYYRKVHFGIRQPSIGLPAIFSTMTNLLQDDLQGKRTESLHPALPKGRFVKKEGFLKSIPVPPRGRSQIVGRFDLLTELDDGSHALIDVKFMEPRKETLDKFDRQLLAYKFALENPLQNRPIKVNKIGLVVVQPKNISLHKGRVYYRTDPIWHEIPCDIDRFYRFISQVETILLGDMPSMSKACDWCQYRAGLSK